ncbi:MAG: DoxX family membrane protein, partial [Verrucomicrobia bacterium]|nr:DoxX family membrane protein [Verrucomicrobiota bacterium]
MEYHSTSSNQSPAGFVLSDLCPLVLRFATGLTMLYFQAWYQSFRAWSYVWDKQSWSLVDQFEELGFGMPGIFATTLIALCAILSVGLITGIYTRICAFLMLSLVTFILIVPVELSGSLNVQALLLYAGCRY